jgi:hypothetical protein
VADRLPARSLDEPGRTHDRLGEGSATSVMSVISAGEAARDGLHDADDAVLRIFSKADAHAHAEIVL